MGIQRVSKRGVAVFFALMIAFAIAFVGAAQMPTSAYAEIYPVNTEQTASADDNAAAADEATIADDEVPMSSGLGGGEPVSGSNIGMGIQVLIIAGIAIVGAYFVVSTRRLNSSINKMKDSIR